MHLKVSLDTLITQIDGALRTLFPAEQRQSMRPSPADSISDTSPSLSDKKHIAALMRVNHAGEVCAQALYQGQALTAKLPQMKEHLAQAAVEETDHLAWCEQRLAELGSQPSRINPLWYGASFVLGALAGLAGDSISLGFVAETERQVTAHLKNHIGLIPSTDKKSRAILKKMQEDEEQQAALALKAGALELPHPIKQLMNAVSKIMTKTSYYF